MQSSLLLKHKVMPLRQCGSVHAAGRPPILQGDSECGPISSLAPSRAGGASEDAATPAAAAPKPASEPKLSMPKASFKGNISWVGL